jgi:hypothetical protein
VAVFLTPAEDTDKIVPNSTSLRGAASPLARSGGQRASIGVGIERLNQLFQFNFHRRSWDTVRALWQFQRLLGPLGASGASPPSPCEERPNHLVFLQVEPAGGHAAPRRYGTIPASCSIAGFHRKFSLGDGSCRNTGSP